MALTKTPTVAWQDLPDGVRLAMRGAAKFPAGSSERAVLVALAEAAVEEPRSRGNSRPPALDADLEATFNRIVAANDARSR